MGRPKVSTATSSEASVQLNASAAWALRLAGVCALVNGAGFGAFDIPAILHLARDQEVWYALGNPTYGHGPFEAHEWARSVRDALTSVAVSQWRARGGRRPSIAGGH